MGKKPPSRYRPIYLGEWLDRLDATVGDVAKAAKVDQSYISNLIAGRKKNPSALILLDISEFLKITVNDLYKQPPPKPTLDTLSGFSSVARETLFRRSSSKH